MLVKFKIHDTSLFSLYIASLLNVNSSSISLLCLVEFAFSVMLEMLDRFIGVDARSYRSMNLMPLHLLANSTALML